MSERSAFHPFVLARRGVAARNALAVVFVLLTGAFFRLQVLQHDRYRMKSESNRLRPIPLPAPRGLILDRHGAVIAENVPGYSVSLLAESEDSLRARLGRLAPIIVLDSAATERVVGRFRAAPYEPTVLVKDAPFPLVARLEEHSTELPGLVIQTEPKREYPDSFFVAHLVGYVGEVTEADLAGPYKGRRPGTVVGKDGLERQYESTLAGSDGVRFVEVDALGRVVRDEGAAAALPPVPGRALHTTIDLGLQRFVASIFPPGRHGAMVAMDPFTGDILALYSSPAYDPNAFVGGISPELWDTLNGDPGHPLLDRVIAARYPPGSTFKLATTLLALEDGLVDFDSRMPQPCRGGFQFGTRFFHCWDPKGHGSLNLVQAIANSCDTYFYQLGLKLSVASIVSGGAGLGFGDRTGIDLPGEIRPAFPDSNYYDRVYGRGGWTQAVALNLAIGQGEDAQTLINMVRFYSTLANGGRVVRPHIFATSHRDVTRVPLPDSVFLGIRKALLAVVEQGTARSVRMTQLQLAGKTGTAQETNGKGLNDGWFIGFAPADRPLIVVGGVFEDITQHGTVVAPYVARIAERYVLGPDTTARGRASESVPLEIQEDTAAGATPLPARPRAPVPGGQPAPAAPVPPDTARRSAGVPR
ncbi:MAG TPA: penicillin-binding protein 2 [Gemmatimonadales bacterium]|nr:penicillin-binding protein 2 [Gemmatimonadales bacterium]